MNNILKIYISNTHDVFEFVKLIFPEVVKVLQIRKKGEMYMVKIKAMNNEFYYLTLSTMKEEVEFFKTRTKEKYLINNGLMLEDIPFCLMKNSLKRSCGVSHIQEANGVFLLFFHFNIGRGKINSILKTSF